jgi:two-component system OmpR family response regulator
VVTAGTAPEARLLVVEDDVNIVELLAASLRYAGFEVTTARDGRQAVAAARELRPDLIVLDVMLPGLDGFEVARRRTRTAPAARCCSSPRGTAPRTRSPA